MCITVTTLIALFKTEKNYDTDEAAVHPNILKTYKLLFRIVKLPSIKMLAIVLLTLFVCISIVNNVYVNCLGKLQIFYLDLVMRGLNNGKSEQMCR